MIRRVVLAVSVVLLSGSFAAAFAQQTTRIKKSTDVTPSWTYKGSWYGFLTCNRLQRNGNTVTPDQVKKCVADGGSYILSGGGRMDIDPKDKDKASAYAGKQVEITGTRTSQTYGTGPTSDKSIEGLYAGGDRPATRFEGVSIISVKVMPDEARQGVEADFGARVSEKAQQ